VFCTMVSAASCMYLLPERPAHVPRHRNFFMVLQWILVPMTMVVFSSIPGLESQIRLAIGRYLGFWVTPKARAGTIEAEPLPEVTTSSAEVEKKD